ncbi:MurR/RpiR family transcriptional regulator [Bacillus massilinigeriensis]|uniref:MurR/RpiR family transcriptional regulator n=1 Tax=Bacillus massilionigeriensis TaxID=1805475 RepID=UPI00096B1244|nr:MurR/RpiR family transcriptional regulator [Bacillus massilionigeriensis]
MNQTDQHINTLVMLKSIYPSLSKTEQKVADYVLENPEETIYSSVTLLAEKSQVGETSVIRFCRKLGFKGFQDFKLAIAQDLVNPSEQVHGQINDNDSAETICQKITSHNIAALNNTMSLLSQQELEKAVEVFSKANRILFFGIGSSGITANDAKYRFMRLGFHADFATDSHLIAMYASLVKKGDVVVGISSSGSTKDLIEGIKLSKENGAHIIVLTNHAKSPITNYADTLLLAASKETPFHGGAFASKIAQIHVLDLLSTLIAMNQKEQSATAIEKTAKSVVDKLY